MIFLYNMFCQLRIFNLFLFLKLKEMINDKNETELKQTF